MNHQQKYFYIGFISNCRSIELEQLSRDAQATDLVRDSQDEMM